MLIVGLGNPGKEYEKTHHNAGFMALDRIANSLNVSFKEEKKFKCYITSFLYNGEKHYLIKPTTYMNLSGEAVRLVSNYYKISTKDIIIFYDDMDIPCGSIRIRKNGSAGGHNGMKSIFNELGTTEITRVRLGTARANSREKDDVVDFVLSPFSKAEKELFDPVLDKMPDLFIDFLNKGTDYIMNNYNKK